MTVGLADRRTDNRWLDRVIALGVVVVLTASPADRLSAQVGHDPARSPFQDLRRGTGPALQIGYLTGERGSVGVGQSNGLTYGVRYEAAVGGPTLISLGFAYAATNRFVVDPLKDSTSRKSGPFADDVALIDLGLQILLTGPKTWNGLAPYIGAAMGFALSHGSPPDSSDYAFGTKFTLAPGAGVRWYPTRRITVQADARALFWKLRYPASFKVPSPADSSRVLPVNAPDTDWTTHPWFSIGVGWIF